MVSYVLAGICASINNGVPVLEPVHKLGAFSFVVNILCWKMSTKGSSRLVTLTSDQYKLVIGSSARSTITMIPRGELPILHAVGNTTTQASVIGHAPTRTRSMCDDERSCRPVAPSAKRACDACKRRKVRVGCGRHPRILRATLTPRKQTVRYCLNTLLQLRNRSHSMFLQERPSAERAKAQDAQAPDNAVLSSPR